MAAASAHRVANIVGTPLQPGSDSDDDTNDDDAVTNLIANCTALKIKGNDKFKLGECGAAVTVYQEAVDKLTSDAAKKALGDYFKSNKDAPDTASPLLASLHGNMAACHVKVQQWESAIIAASAALKIEPSNVKARFRRGVAYSNVGQYDESKADLTATIRADPKNREARTILEVVNAAIKERTSGERAIFGRAFSGPSLYAEEEKKAAKAAKQAEALKAAEEAALLEEWRGECDALRCGQPRNPSVDLLSEAARAGDAEARANLDRLAPITLEEFREAKAKAMAKEKARVEKEEADRRAVRETERRAKSDVTVLEASDDEEEELLKGLSKGYKTRSDGTKTSYFDRSEKVDPKTKALLDAAKAPKKLEPADITDAHLRVLAGSVGAAAPSAAPAGGGAAVGSVWNTAGTYEERDVSAWAVRELKVRLVAIRLDAAGGELRVTAVEGLQGHASIISNRGKLKRPFEFSGDVKWEFADGDPVHACSGTISYSEIVPAPSDAAVGFACELTETFGSPPTAATIAVVRAARGALQTELDAAMQGFVDALAKK